MTAGECRIIDCDSQYGPIVVGEQPFFTLESGDLDFCVRASLEPFYQHEVARSKFGNLTNAFGQISIPGHKKHRNSQGIDSSQFAQDSSRQFLQKECRESRREWRSLWSLRGNE